MTEYLKKTYMLFFCLFAFIISYGKDINILDRGAKPDGIFDNTSIIQEAINECHDDGGGTIYFPSGIFRSGGIFLKDNVSLSLHKMSILKAISNETLYLGRHFSESGFIRLDSVYNVSITGEGTVDGSGDEEAFQKGNNGMTRPYLIHVRDSRKIDIKGITLKNAAFWTLRLLGNEGVRIDGVNILGHANWNNDGIDIDSKDVIVSNCFIDVDDDAICLKSDRANQICENITVTNCVLASNCNYIKFGTASHGGFRNIAISNCVLKPASVSHLRKWNERIEGVKDSISGTSGIALEVVNGGFIDQVAISNMSMRGVQTPIFIRLGGKRHPKGMSGSLKNVTISNVIAYACSKIPSTITAAPGLQVENITLRDIRVVNTVSESDKGILSRPVTEGLEEYPENRMMGHSLPGSGLYVRRAKNILIDNFQIETQAPDARPVMWFDNAYKVTVRHVRDLSNNTQESVIKKESEVMVLQ